MIFLVREKVLVLDLTMGFFFLGLEFETAWRGRTALAVRFFVILGYRRMVLELGSCASYLCLDSLV